MDWPPIRVVWSLAQDSSLGALASAGDFASEPFISMAGLASLLGSCARVGRVKARVRSVNTPMPKNLFIWSPFVVIRGPNYRRRILRRGGVASQTGVRCERKGGFVVADWVRGSMDEILR